MSLKTLLHNRKQAEPEFDSDALIKELETAQDLGNAVRDFCNGKIGKYLLSRTAAEKEAAMSELMKIDLRWWNFFSKFKAYKEAQEKYYLAVAFEQYFARAIMAANQAAQQLQQKD